MYKVAFVLSLTGLSLVAQAADNPMSTAVKNQFNIGKTNLTKAAEKMPEESYSFKPTDSVRSFGELLGHVANAQYMFCSAATGEANPNKTNFEKTATTKASLVEALNTAFAFCDKAYDALTDQSAPETVKFGRGEQARIGVLTFNNMHNYEHYGNVATYMRLKNLVPPSSEGR